MPEKLEQFEARPDYDAKLGEIEDELSAMYRKTEEELTDYFSPEDKRQLLEDLGRLQHMRTTIDKHPDEKYQTQQKVNLVEKYPTIVEFWTGKFAEAEKLKAAQEAVERK